MSSSQDQTTTPVTTLEQDLRNTTADRSKVAPGEIAVGVVIGRASEYFDFFVFGIASVLVFPYVFFPFLGRLEGMLAAFIIFSFAFLARPFGTALFMTIQRHWGRGVKLTVALFMLGTATVGMALLPTYDTLGVWTILLLALFRILQGFALGGSWDGLPSLLALNAPRHRRSWYAMLGQLGADALGEVGHLREIRRAAGVEPLPDLAGAHLRLGFGDAGVDQRRLQGGAGQADQRAQTLDRARGETGRVGRDRGRRGRRSRRGGGLGHVAGLRGNRRKTKRRPPADRGARLGVHIAIRGGFVHADGRPPAGSRPAARIRSLAQPLRRGQRIGEAEQREPVRGGGPAGRHAGEHRRRARLHRRHDGGVVGGVGPGALALGEHGERLVADRRLAQRRRAQLAVRHVCKRSESAHSRVNNA